MYVLCSTSSVSSKSGSLLMMACWIQKLIFAVRLRRSAGDMSSLKGSMSSFVSSGFEGEMVSKIY